MDDGWIGGLGGSAGSCVDSKQTQTDMGVGKLRLAPVLCQAHRTYSCLSASSRGDSCCVERTSHSPEASGHPTCVPLSSPCTAGAYLSVSGTGSWPLLLLCSLVAGFKCLLFRWASVWGKHQLHICTQSLRGIFIFINRYHKRTPRNRAPIHCWKTVVGRGWRWGSIRGS